MARLPRSVAAGLPHFVIHRGLNGQVVFHDAVDRRRYVAALLQASREAGVAVHGYGLCPDEVRLLLTPQSARALTVMMQSIGRRYVRAYNARHARSGTPWDGRFRSTVIDAPQWFMRCLQYAEDCGAASCAVDGPSGFEPVFTADGHTSSAEHHLGLRMDELIAEHELFWAIGNTPFDREVAYRRVLAQALPPATIGSIRNATLKGWALGSPAFARSMAALTGRRLEPLPRGRPSLSAKAGSCNP